MGKVLGLDSQRNIVINDRNCLCALSALNDNGFLAWSSGVVSEFAWFCLYCRKYVEFRIDRAQNGSVTQRILLPDAANKKMGTNRKKERNRGWIYSVVVSPKTTLVFLAIFAIFLTLGMIVPQASDTGTPEEYPLTIHGYPSINSLLSISDLFHAWYFALTVSLFALHLMICIAHRLGVIIKRPSFRLFTREDLLQRDYSFTVSCPSESVGTDIEKTLKKFGFGNPKYYSEDARLKRVVCEKGFPFRWLSWLYHACILALIIGFCVTYLLAFEEKSALAVGGRESFGLRSAQTNYAALQRILGLEPKETQLPIEIELDDLVTEYMRRPALRYPEKAGGRSPSVWRLGENTVRYEMAEDSIALRNRFSELSIYRDGELVSEKKVGIGDPLRYAGLTIHQVESDYKFSLNVGDTTIEGISEGELFSLPQMEGEFRLVSPCKGILLGHKGEIEILAPSAMLQYRPPSGPATGNWADVGRLTIGRSAEVMRTEMILSDFREKIILRSRYDPALPFLWFAGAAVLVLMALRIYLPWYQLRCHADTSSGRLLVTVSIRMVGLLAQPEQLKEKLIDALRAPPPQ